MINMKEMFRERGAEKHANIKAQKSSSNKKTWFNRFISAAD